MRPVYSTGRLLTAVSAFTPRDSANAPVLTAAESLETYDVVVEELMHTKVVRDPPVAWCVQLNRRAPSVELLERWQRTGRRVVAIADCPRTYASMVYTPSDPPPPRGWIDPVQIAVDSILSWAEETVIITARTGQGMASTVNKCEVVRVRGKWTKASCATTEWRIS